MKKIVFLTLFFTSCIFALNVGDKVPNDVLNTLKTNKKIIVLDFFASWCASCKIEIPEINKSLNKINSNSSEIILINIDDDKNNGVEFINKLNYNGEVIYDTNKKIVKTFNPIGVPAIYVVKDGIITNSVFGAIDNIDEKILNLIKE